MNKIRWMIIGLIVVFAIGMGYWLWSETRPLPGQQLEDLGREHIAFGATVEYNSNPPTSGNHYPDWTRAGVLDTPQDDRYLVHSLEHGYVIMSYNCDYTPTSFLNLVRPAYAQESTPSATPQSATQSAQLSEKFNSDECKQLVDSLRSVYESKGKRKLIVVPRPNLDAKLALTSWRYLDKFNPRGSALTADEKRKIEAFIDGHRDKGPELTMSNGVSCGVIPRSELKGF